MAWMLHALEVGEAVRSVLFAAWCSVRPVLLLGLAAPGPAEGLSLLVEAGLALLGLVGLSALLLGCSKVVYLALLDWALFLHIHNFYDQYCPCKDIYATTSFAQWVYYPLSP